MSRPLALIAILFFATSVTADDKDKDWAGKLIMIRPYNVSLGKPGVAGLEIDDQRLSGDGVYKVRAEKGEFLQLVDSDWIFKSDAVLVEDAGEFFTAEIKKQPKDAWNYGRRALAHLNKGRANSSFDLGQYLGTRGDTEAALADFNQAIRLTPKDPVWWSYRGWLYLSRREYDKANDDHSEVIRLAPKGAYGYFGWAMTKHARGHYERAVEGFDFALERDPKDIYSLGYKARALAKLKKYDEALRGFEAAYKLAQPVWLQKEFAWFFAVCPRDKLRDGKRAVELAKKALEAAGKDADREFHATLAAAHAEAGDFEKAVTEQRKALEDKSIDAESRKQMEARLELYRAKKPYRDDE